MKPFLPVLALFLGLPAGAAPQGRPALPLELKSRHYDMRTSATREEGKELLDFMELVHSTYMALLKPLNPDQVRKRRFTVVLYKSYREYIQAGAPPGSGAYYDGKELVGYYSTTFMRPFFAHEGMHQFTDATSKNFKAFNMWFTEGIADCIGNCEVRNRKLYMCVKSGAISRMRLQLIQAAIRQGAVYPLRRFMTLSKRQFMADGTRCYAQAWSFCHFLISYPKLENRTSQIPNGKYRKNLAGYYELVRKGGTSHWKAWDAAFRGIPLERLEREWKEFVLSMDSGKYIGIRGGEIDDESIRQLNLPPGRTGLLIEEVLPDGVGGQAGIRKGDVLVKFNGKQFPRHSALNALRIWIQDARYGRPVKVVVVRDGRELEVRCTWKRPKKK